MTDHRARPNGSKPESIEVLSSGLLTTVQDTCRRRRWAHLGVPQGGVMDAPAAEDANWLVGNPADAALLECTAIAPTLRFKESVVIAVCGADLGVTTDGRPLPVDCAIRVPSGTVLESGERRTGMRAYLAVSGGIDVPEVLGSRSTDLRTGFGGFAGRVLQPGDLLPVGRSASSEGRVIYRSLPRIPQGTHRVRVLPGLHRGRAALVAASWRVGASDRQGMRLEGPRISGGSADLPSFGVIPGAIQLPPDGVPIVLLADAQPTGGYPVIGVVPAADLPILAQLAPGDPVRLTPTSYQSLALSLPGERARYLDDYAVLRQAGG